MVAFFLNWWFGSRWQNQASQTTFHQFATTFRKT